MKKIDARTVSDKADDCGTNDEKTGPRYTLLTEKEVARLIRMSVFKLQRDRSRGVGIPCLILGKRSVRYRDIDVWAWIEAHIRKPRR